MGWLFGDKAAVAEYKAARRELDAYGEHQVERHGWGKVYETPEDDRLHARVRETEQHVPWWRR